MYGDFEVSRELEVPLPGGRLIVERIDEESVRLVKELRSSKATRVLSLGARESLSLRPLPPLGGPLEVTCVLFKLPEPLLLLPGARVTLTLAMPADLGIYARGVLVDSVPLTRVKYALYGPSDLGEVCRYVDRGVAESAPSWAAGEISVRIRSLSSSRLEVSRVVIPALGLAASVTEGGEVTFNDVEVEASSVVYAEVRTKTLSSLAERAGRLRYAGEGREVLYVMRYGL
ncbi:MAG: DUF432 domain-containing protein [Fervidicoccaceae archaeon]